MVVDKNLEKAIEEGFPSDVGLWPSKISESFREYWFRNGSKQCQHQNSDFKNSAVIEKIGPAIAHPLFMLENISYQSNFLICPGFAILKARESCIALFANFCQRQITSSLKDSTTGEMGLGEISDDDLCSTAKKLIESYPDGTGRMNWRRN